MMITGILMVSVATVTISTLNASRVMNVKTSTAADARIGLETMTRTLRAAVIPQGETAAITTATTDAVTFYSQINRADALVVAGVVAPTKVEYYHSGGCLMEARTPARSLSAATITAPQFAWDTGRTTKCVLRTVTQTGLFTYYVDGLLSTTALTVPIGGLTSAALPTVKSVKVTVTVVDPANPSVPGIPVNTRTTLDNIVLSAGGTV